MESDGRKRTRQGALPRDQTAARENGRIPPLSVFDQCRQPFIRNLFVIFVVFCANSSHTFHR